jgi:hypothetical protein
MEGLTLASHIILQKSWLPSNALAETMALNYSWAMVSAIYPFKLDKSGDVTGAGSISELGPGISDELKNR